MLRSGLSRDNLSDDYHALSKSRAIALFSDVADLRFVSENYRDRDNRAAIIRLARKHLPLTKSAEGILDSAVTVGG